jgi:NitT/TauT family transport system substrate-binding protein
MAHAIRTPRATAMRSAVTSAAVALLAVLLAAAPGHAETATVRIPRQPGLTYLVFVVMEHDRLVEKHAAALGIPTLAVEYVDVGTNTGSIDALLSGAVDVVSVGVPAFLTMWEKSKGNLDIKGLGSYNAIQLVLLTRNPAVRTIRDFTDASRIAVPGVRASSQATILQMAAEKAFGDYARLDPLTTTRSHPDAVAALLDKSSEIDSHFSAPPYANRELAIPGVHVVLTSTEVYGGPGTIGITSATRKFHDANPKAFRAIFEGQREAMGLINTERRRIAQLYKEATRDPQSVDALEAILAEPANVYDFTPHGVMQVAAFMHRTGQLKTLPKDWTEVMFPELHDLPGS